MARVVHFEIHAEDPERAVRFYERVFGWRFQHNAAIDYWLIATGEGPFHAIFERAGFANYAASRLVGVGQLPLEKIVGDPPDAILLGDDGTERNSLAAEALAHPALRMLESTLPTLIVPDRLWLCGLANTGEAVRRLAAFRASLPDRPR